MLQIGLVVFAAASVAASFAGTANGLITARAVMGVGAAMVFPATLAVLSNVFTEPTERATAIGIWSAVTGLAVALGPLTGGWLLAAGCWLLEHFCWGSVFRVNVPIVAGAILVPRTKDPPSWSLCSVSCSSAGSVAGPTRCSTSRCSATRGSRPPASRSPWPSSACSASSS